MARAPVPLSDQVTAREILAQLQAQSERIDVAAKDAREARDAALGLRERLSAENTHEQLARLWAELKQVENASRQDLVNAMSRITDETRKSHDAHDARIGALEIWRQRQEGAHGVLGWVSKYAPWLLSAVLGALAYLKGKL